MINAVKDKICLVTGGGGSIGSAIVRALLRLGAKKVIALDISENNLFDLLTDERNAVAEIASITDAEKIDYLFSAYRPEIVFHAAAHKHVPFMEMYPEEAVKNNILGTQTVMDAAEKHGAEKSRTDSKIKNFSSVLTINYFLNYGNYTKTTRGRCHEILGNISKTLS